MTSASKVRAAPDTLSALPATMTNLRRSPSGDHDGRGSIAQTQLLRRGLDGVAAPEEAPGPLSAGEEGDVEHGDEGDADQRRREHAAEDGDADRAARAGAGAGREDQREDAEDE